ncbi:glycosyltransferase [Myroides marinus]|uniref:glycosyltransferase family 2 protein n=1 Tax=Myroides marinus TaxID=703342 RepID=UPI002577A2A3|nr:glycosyltransferase [Myroides marinus]MDM1369577.1 glycosyltransferase [Myroides marinus]MDM1372797.1 glycosyltransferase [Myroides marinus]MDM1376300.1 glycosyltransferase [Myroides marinus]MDM1382106.1 glycosyltransferase [Myroides marinus]MDM1391646.1 glycosyltransferase [Myroides marinus]
MNQTSLISVIVPVYNVEVYLIQCLDSIVNQSYRNLEIIIVNDGTKDNSAEICKQYKEKDNRIVFLEKENGGISSARNLGIDYATGDYIAFIDSDDFIHNKYFEILLKNIEDFDVVFCNAFNYETNTTIPISSETSFETVEFTSKELLRQINSFKLPLVIVPWGKLYKREIWNNLRYPVGRIHEEQAVAHLYIDQAEKIKYIDTSLYYYRQNVVGSATNTICTQKLNDFYQACQEREEFFTSKKMYEEASLLHRTYNEYYIRKMLKMKNEGGQMSISFILTKNKLPLLKKIELVLKLLIS